MYILPLRCIVSFKTDRWIQATVFRSWVCHNCRLPFHLPSAASQFTYETNSRSPPPSNNKQKEDIIVYPIVTRFRFVGLPPLKPFFLHLGSWVVCFAIAIVSAVWGFFDPILQPHVQDTVSQICLLYLGPYFCRVCEQFMTVF